MPSVVAARLPELQDSAAVPKSLVVLAYILQENDLIKM